jgi:hypothetical protein
MALFRARDRSGSTEAASPKTEPSPVVYFRSRAVDRCGRTGYAAALMRRVKVDSYRMCAAQPGSAGTGQRFGGIVSISVRHKFTLVLENSLVDDYVSEKFFNALSNGSMPVYRGAPNIAAFAPADHCFNECRRLRRTRRAGGLSQWLNEYDDAHQEYLTWKYAGLSPGFLRLVESVRGNPRCRLCEYLRRSEQFGPR